MATANQVAAGIYRDMQAMTIYYGSKSYYEQLCLAIAIRHCQTFAHVKRLGGKRTSVGAILRFLDVLCPVHLLSDPCDPYLHLDFGRLAIPNRDNRGCNKCIQGTN